LNLISKKDLLAVTGISYGQLYRWKRERLIPEEWFIKQSSYTGQETFFPREQILSRVQSILELKDGHSLEELAGMFSPGATKNLIPADEVFKAGLVNANLARVMAEAYGREEYDFFEIGLIAAMSEACRKAGMTDDVAANLMRRSARAASKEKCEGAECTLFKSDEGFYAVFTEKAVGMAFDSDIEVIGQFPVSEKAEELKIKYEKYKGEGNHV
jgi:hypothetical protein